MTTLIFVKKNPPKPAHYNIFRKDFTMKIFLPALLMLMLSGIAEAAVGSLRVTFFPDTRLFAAGLPIPVRARANGQNLAYRFVLERYESGRYAPMREWAGENEIRLVSDAGVLPPGKYRLVTRASEGTGQPETMVRDTFQIIGRYHPDFQRVSQTNQIERDFDLAVTAIRWELATVRKQLLLRRDVTSEFNDFQTGNNLAYELGDLGVYADCCFFWKLDALQAPGGGPSVIAGVPGDGDATGAIVLEVLYPPDSDSDWRRTEVGVTLPAYPAVNGLSRRTEIIRWED